MTDNATATGPTTATPPADGHTVLAVDGITKSYGDVPALRGLDLRLAAGEIVGLVGPNGAGKSTLVSIIVGLMRPDSGTVRVGGYDPWTDRRRVADLVGLVPQELGIYPQYTVRQNLRFFASLAGVAGSELAAREDDLLERLGLSDLASRRAGTLSGGEKRRLHTAIGLVHHPQLLLLDEATAGMDVGGRLQVLELVRDLAAEGAAVLYATHYLGDVEALDADVVLVEEGRVLTSGPVRELCALDASSIVELLFDGPPPDIFGRYEATVDDQTVRITTEDPQGVLIDVVPSLDGGSGLVNVDIVRPSLETVYLSLTGRRYAAGPATGDEA